MPEDTALLRDYVQNGSDDAFAILVRRYLGLVYHSAVRRTDGDVHLAEDVTQMVFVSLAREARSLCSHSSLAGWLHVATRNAGSQVRRTEKRRINREQEAFAMQEHSTGSEIDWERIRPEIDSALDELGVHDRDAVLLRFMKNRRFAEIAATLGVSDEAARMRVDRALEKLRGKLTKRGVTSTSAAIALGLESQANAALPAGLAETVIRTALLANGALSGGTTAMLGGFYLMKASKLTVGTLAVITFLAMGVAIYQTMRLRELEAAFATAQSTNSKLARIQREAPPAAIEQARPERPMVARGSETPQPPAEASTGKGKQQIVTPKNSFGESMKSPEFLAAWRKQQSRSINARYADGFAALNLPAEKLGRLKELLLTRDEARNDANDAGKAAELPTAELHRAIKQAMDAVNHQIIGLVGETGLAQLERSEKAMIFKPVIETAFAVDLGAAGEPLTAAQLAESAVVMSNYWETKWQPSGTLFRGIASFTNPQEADPQSGLTPHAEALLSRYAQFMTSTQLRVVRDYFVEQIRWGQVSKKR